MRLFSGFDLFKFFLETGDEFGGLFESGGEDPGDEAVEGGVVAGVVFFRFEFAEELLIDDEAEGIGAGDD